MGAVAVSNLQVFGLIGVNRFSGAGRLRGTALTQSGDPAVSHKVQVFAEFATFSGGKRPVGLLHVTAVKTDQGGGWDLPFIDGSKTYTVIAFDPEGQYDPVIKAGLIPEPME
ncbi:hypothetical protein Q673_02600 [Marinobacter sp. EN3]|nr:hypothetical protein Q673_02600 [Marinobacter sp. EN3]